MKKYDNAELDAKFEHLIEIENLTSVEFFKKKWESFEEPSIYSRYHHISFLDKMTSVEKDLCLLNYSLKHLNRLVNYLCENFNEEEIENTLLFLTIQDWDIHPEEPISPSFFISYRWKGLFKPDKPFVPPHTTQSKYIIDLLDMLGVRDQYFVYDDRSPINPELQRVNVGLKKHPDSRLVTLDRFIEDKSL